MRNFIISTVIFPKHLRTISLYNDIPLLNKILVYLEWGVYKSLGETYKNKKGERVTDTTWHTLVAWGPLVTILEKYTQKGSEVAIEGKLVNSNYFDKDGIKRYTTEVQLSDLFLLGGR